METLAHSLRASFLEVPDRTALTLQFGKAPDQTITYRQLVAGAAGYASAFEAAGLAPGEVVVLILQHGLGLAASFFGAILGGQVPAIMPFLTEKLAPDKYRRELSSLIEITRPAAIVTYPDFENEVRAAMAQSSHNSVRAVILDQAVDPQSDPDFSRLRGLQRSPDDIVLLQHSSGTTGLQKGVALSHRAVLRQLAVYSASIQLGPADIVVSWLPLYHDMGLIAGFIMPVISRVPLVLLSPFDWVRAPARLMRAVSTYRGTLSWLPNFAYNFCAQKTRPRDLEGLDLSSWRAVINCSEPVRHNSHRLFAEHLAPYGLRPAALATCYAMAENVFAVTQSSLDGPVTVDTIDRRALITEKVARPTSAEGEVYPMLSCGQPLPNVQVRILDEQRREVPDRVIGEIAILSDCMLTGYYHRPDATETAFHEGWYLTGDLGYLANGEVYVTGRKKDLIIVGGKNVHPQDLEQLAGEVQGIHAGRVVAFGVYDPEAGTEDVVLVAEAESDDRA